ncbi:MAG: hypothetical protein IT425_07950 [Pirellulales bacterium]|nr:hypothetical protein [Pirellulales bacterium]
MSNDGLAVFSQQSKEPLRARHSVIRGLADTFEKELRPPRGPALCAPAAGVEFF